MDGEFAYIGKELCPPLINAIAEVCKQKPEDPISYIANCLHEYRQENHLHEASEEHTLTEPERDDTQNTAGMGCGSSVTVATNTFESSLSLQQKDMPVEPTMAMRIIGYGRSKWPIRCWTPLTPSFNVNAHQGGGAALVQVSNAFGGKGSETQAEIFLLRCGVDGNHASLECLCKSHHGHFGPETALKTNEYGDVYLRCLFGSNHVSVMSNLPEHNPPSHGVLVHTDYTGAAELPVNVNGSEHKEHSEHGGGCTLLLCSSTDQPIHSAVYMIRSGYKDNHYQSSLLVGEDKWSFDKSDQGILQVTGIANTAIAVYHNRENLIKSGCSKGQAFTHCTQCVDGSVGTVLFRSYQPCMGAMLVLCSSSSGDEDASAAAVYSLSVDRSQVQHKFLGGSTGLHYSHDDADLWTFTLTDKEVKAIGPADPCRYSILTNLTMDVPEILPSTTNHCLATGESDAVKGSMLVTDLSISVWLTKPCDVIIKDNGKEILGFAAKDFKASNDKYAFHSKWPALIEGLHNISAFALGKGSKEGEIELTGSPYQLVVQPKGVVHAVNIGGQTYEAKTGIIYNSEFTPYINLDPEFCFGTMSKACGGLKTTSRVPHVVCGTEDNDLYCWYRSRVVEAKDESKVIYVVNVPNGEYILRLHFVGTKACEIHCNGKNLTQEIAKCLTKSRDPYPYTAHQVDLPVKVVESVLNLNCEHLSAFALLDKNYKDKVKDKATLQAEYEESQKLINESDPLPRTMTRKERKLVGWSSNLLQNPSAQNCMSGWNLTGKWGTAEGGFGTEKAFTTSFMDCSKYQEVNLLQHFDIEYLDTAPQIQISEYYREGSCGGGFYRLTAVLLDEHGQKVSNFDSGEIGSIYRNNKWEQMSHTFQDYGPGVRRVGFQSYGRDDKYWADNYGPWSSCAVVRVKRMTRAADDDSFADIETRLEMVSSSKHREKLVRKILTDNEQLVQELVEDTDVAETGKTVQRQPGLVKRFSFTDHKKKLKKREIRVFVSSTFRDFKKEREEIIKKTFREINAMCADRNVFFTYVDLRWGITENQTQHGQTIAICLQEIERCRPYFVCMMGERFGWCQRANDPDKLLNQSFDYAINNFPAQYEWLEDYRYESSVTQLEIMHGVLNDIEASKNRSFFYMRDSISKEEVDETEYKMKSSESEWHRDKQQALKQLILDKSDVLSVKNYHDIQDVCTLLKQDLERSINIDFPAGVSLSSLEIERQAHLAFGEARERVYIGREEYFTQISQNLTSNNSQPFVVLGESGSGKSALIANWTSRLGNGNKDSFIFLHFIGSSAESASSTKLMRRLYEEMKEYFGFHMAIPTSDSNLARDLPTWLTLAGAQQTCYIILDALNQLDDGGEGNEQDLLWIPKELPQGVHMLLSTLPGRAFNAVEAAGWPHMKVEPLQPSEKHDIITGYLEKIYGKTLSEEQKNLMINTEKTNNPLYLKALLDEVRMFGNFRQLTSKIEEFLTADTPGDLFAKILERFENDFEQGHNERRGLVRDTTSAIWCSNKGMSESELLHFLQVPSAVWSPFYLSLRENLVNRNGLLNFFHDHLRQAVQNKYLSTEEQRREQYAKLADFFNHRETDQRKVEELPFLLAKSGDVEKLKITISDLNVFKKLVRSEDGKFDLIKSWRTLGEFSQVAEAYKHSLSTVPDSEKHSDHFAQVKQDLAEFYVDLGLFAEARTLFTEVLTNLENKYKNTHSTVVCDPSSQTRKYRCTHPTVIESLHNLGEVCEKQKDLKQAEEYFAEAIRRQNRVVTPTQKLTLTQGLLGQATVHYINQNSSEAKKYLVRAREIATNVLGPRHHYVAAIINKLGQLCYKQGRLDEALAYFTQDLKLTRGEVGTSHPRTAGILNDLALVYDDSSDQLAGELYEAALHILLLTYGQQHPEVALTRYNLGCFYFATNYFSRAKFQFEESARVYTLFLGSDHPDTVEAAQALSDVSAFC